MEFILYHVQDIKKAIYEKKLDPCIPIGHGTQISDLTAAKALTNIADVTVLVEYGGSINGKRDTKVIKRPELWLKGIQYIDEIYKGKPAESFIKRRYAENESWQDTCNGMGISRGVYFAYKADVIRALELYAVGVGLLPWHK